MTATRTGARVESRGGASAARRWQTQLAIMTGCITYNLCPYTLKPLVEIAKTNAEHIFADAIRGVKGYTIRVSAKSNGNLGTLIDAPLISWFLSGLRLTHGIKSRTGDPELKFRGDHHIFARHGVAEILNLQPRSGKAKVYQVKQVRGVLHCVWFGRGRR